jgi:hypothetical protein
VIPLVEGISICRNLGRAPASVSLALIRRDPHWRCVAAGDRQHPEKAAEPLPGEPQRQQKRKKCDFDQHCNPHVGFHLRVLAFFVLRYGTKTANSIGIENDGLTLVARIPRRGPPNTLWILERGLYAQEKPIP